MIFGILIYIDQFNHVSYFQFRPRTSKPTESTLLVYKPVFDLSSPKLKTRHTCILNLNSLKTTISVKLAVSRHYLSLRQLFTFCSVGLCSKLFKKCSIFWIVEVTPGIRTHRTGWTQRTGLKLFISGLFLIFSLVRFKFWTHWNAG